MNFQKMGKRVGMWGLRLATLLATLFLCAPMGLLRADGSTEPLTTIHKTLTPVQGKTDEYELSLDITSTMGSEIQSDPLDVVLVADLSGSMNKTDVQTASGSMVSRIQSLKNTLTGTNGRQGLIDSILSKPNNRLAIVGFGGKIDNQRVGYVSDSYSYYGYTYRYWPYWAGYYSGINTYDDANTILGWDSNASNAKYAAGNMAIAGGYSLGNEAGIGTGTNITAGMQLANQLLGTARSNAKKVVILLSDGFANMYYDSNGYTIYNYNNQDGVTETAPDWFERALNEETDKVSKEIAPKVDGFYSVKFRYSNSTDSISTLKSYISNYNGNIPNEVFFANDENQLQEQFKEITKKILPLGIHHVTITDILSKYVKLLPDNASHIRVVKVENGQEETLGADKVTLETKKNDAGLVEVTAKFNPDYILDDSVKYALKFRVTSTQEADDTSAGDKTVTADDAEGGDATKLYSNKGAKVTYSYGKGSTQTKEVQYKEKPTFSPRGPLTIPVKVEWKGVTDGTVPHAPQPENLQLTLVQKGKDGGPDKENYRTSTAQRQDVRLRNASFDKVARGYDYEVKPPEAPGYTVEVEKTGTAEQPSFKVVYRQLPTLKVTKIAKGNNIIRNKGFKINIELTDADGQPINGTFGKVKVTNGKAQISLLREHSEDLKYLPRNAHYKVEEDAESRVGYDVQYDSSKEGTLDDDKQTTVTNRRLPRLSITKKVTGVFANLLQSFKVDVRLTDAKNQPLNGEYEVNNNGKIEKVMVKDGLLTLELKRNQHPTLYDLPLGAHYRVEEQAESSRGYQVTYENQEGTLDADKAATVTNDKNSIPETGVDFLSSELMLGIILPLSGLLFTIFLGHLVVNRRK
ncbi:DUF7601 domain-containing protein [Streptococcus oralis]|uniref:Fibronectin-binding protein n=1 Tax=Streptococcus oralis TaxID=1303 RepID=A0A139P0F8_STROR|nr:VWA domain-containing protein [Streptococcus oralis]KXT81710.1 Fibronectin-binding protein [Streptococcus oralis]